MEIFRAQGGQQQRQKRSQRRAGDGHLHRSQQRGQDSGGIPPIRREHGGDQVRQMAPPRPEQGGGAVGEPCRSQQKKEKCQRPQPALSGGTGHD